MPTPNLLVICGVAFLVVFVVLAVLAAVMRGLMLLFPEPDEAADGIEPALVAAITEAVTAAYPGTQITRIEESR
jgi:hypothetical protein